MRRGRRKNRIEGREGRRRGGGREGREKGKGGRKGREGEREGRENGKGGRKGRERGKTPRCSGRSMLHSYHVHVGSHTLTYHRQHAAPGSSPPVPLPPSSSTPPTPHGCWTESQSEYHPGKTNKSHCIIVLSEACNGREICCHTA